MALMKTRHCLFKLAIHNGLLHNLLIMIWQECENGTHSYLMYHSFGWKYDERDCSIPYYSIQLATTHHSFIPMVLGTNSFADNGSFCLRKLVRAAKRGRDVSIGREYPQIQTVDVLGQENPIFSAYCAIYSHQYVRCPRLQRRQNLGL